MYVSQCAWGFLVGERERKWKRKRDIHTHTECVRARACDVAKFDAVFSINILGIEYPIHIPYQPRVTTASTVRQLVH